MDFKRWQEKATRMLEESLTIEAYQNTESGAYFALDKHRIFYIDKSGICSAVRKHSDWLEQIFKISDSAEVATNIERAKIDKRCVLRLSVGEKKAVLQEKFTRVFPKNAVYSIVNEKSPVLVSILDGAELKPIAVVAPYVCRG